MTVLRCRLCDGDPLEGRRYGNAGLADGELCPLCYQPTCRYHLTTVRWRWRDGGSVASGLICKACKNSYAHRDWDVARRDWIS